MPYDVYTAKPGDAKAMSWRYALVEHARDLTRHKAALLVTKLRDDPNYAGHRVLVYTFGRFKYAVM